MKKKWSMREGEDFLEYSSRLNSELNIKNIKENFNTDEFYKFLTNKKNDTYYNGIYNGILKAIGCNVKEASLGGALVGKSIDLELYASLARGSFFSLVSNEMYYIRIAEFIHIDDDLDSDEQWFYKYGLIYFKNKKKYLMVCNDHFSRDQGESFATEFFSLLKDLNTTNKKKIEKFINERIKTFHFSPKYIYLNKIIKWNLGNISKNLPDYADWGDMNSEELLKTKIWLVNYNKDFSIVDTRMKKKEDYIKKLLSQFH